MEAGEAGGAAAGLYPVDILDDDPEGHREAALAYYATLRGGAPPPAAALSLPAGEQVHLEAASVCLCTLHRDEPRHKILVLVSPQDTKTVVAVYVKESWWATEDVLRTSDPAREGLMEVQTFGERIVLFLLNVVIFGRLERKLDDDDMFFLPHSVREQAKILWRDGAAVGFYTTKRKVVSEKSVKPVTEGTTGRVHIQNFGTVEGVSAAVACRLSQRYVVGCRC
uniref:Family with sequence similarity 169 member B n=1 Tax=Molossus molossus TaxID=27622 RepID=A0A7J8BKF7_MOLMO|nr:family with sequence similarity 169 member B [Molossus molossus]